MSTRQRQQETQPSFQTARPNVVIRGTSYVEVHGGGFTVDASEASIVSVYGDAEIHASGNATVIAWSGIQRVTLEGAAVLVDRSAPAPRLRRGENR